jgi:DNA mismatch repair protein MutS
LEPTPSSEAEMTLPASAVDLDFDQIVDAVVTGRDEYRLRPFFGLPLGSVDAVAYRQEAFADLDGTALSERVATFGNRMRTVRTMLKLAEQMRHRYQRRSWLLTAAVTYVEAVTGLLGDLEQAPITSRALTTFREGLSRYVGSEEFEALRQDMAAASEAISAVRYTLLFYARVIRVRRFGDEADYGTEISSFFARFRQGDASDHHLELSGRPVMNRLEQQVLDRVVALFPETFGALDRFCEAHPAWQDHLVVRFDREVQFYLAYLEVVRSLRASGLPVCYPVLSSSSKAEAVGSTYDLALALRCLSESDEPMAPGSVVTNDYALSEPERIIVVTGPNHGGKTTFARAFGQLHWLAALGCPVPGTRARLFLADRVLSHFGREESLTDMRGRLEDDLVRMREILSQASSASVVILNEIFFSTTLRDATVLSRAILGVLSELDAFSVCVTFVDELASFDRKTVSMVAGVDALDPTVRTFKLERRQADGRAYAVVLAERYGLTHDRVKERLAR